MEYTYDIFMYQCLWCVTEMQTQAQMFKSVRTETTNQAKKPTKLKQLQFGLDSQKMYLVRLVRC